MMKMRWRLRTALASFAVLLSAAGCVTVPYTHRGQLILVPEGTIDKLGAQAYQEVLSKEKIGQDPKLVAVVGDVAERIEKVADKPNYHWQVAVIDNPKQANAFALPGGKVAVYTGLFSVAENTAGLAWIPTAKEPLTQV